MTKDEIETITRRYLQGETTYEIAKDFGVTGPSIAYHLKKAGVELRPKGTQCGLTWEQKTAKVVEMYEQDKTVKQMIAALGIARRDIARIAREQGLKPKQKRKLLTPEQRAEVARRYKAGENYEELRKAFGDVSPSVIQAALKEHGVRPRVGWSKYRTVCWEDRKGRQFIFKSTWEKAYAEYLDERGFDWEYETETYPLEKCRCYTPDFTVWEDGEIVGVVEVHGWLDRATKARITEFVELYPTLPFDLLGPGELAEMELIEESWSAHAQAERLTRFRDQLQQKTLDS